MPLAQLARSALLLDLDGTLLDLASTPEGVVVPDGLADVLAALRPQMGGALAIISGRPIAQVEALLPGIAQAVSGEHGGAFRHEPDAPMVRPLLPELPFGWLTMADNAVTGCPGARLEIKARGFVFHYRAVPEAAAVLRIAAETIAATDPNFEVLPAAMAWEVRPRGADKGTALRSIMDHAPFQGRVPLFIGDDATDLDAICAAQAMGGTGLLVATTFGSPAAVRRWLGATAAVGEWQTL